MFCKATLVTVALALIASASPISQTTGIRIPLVKRTTLQNENGVFDHDRAVIQTVNTLKYVYNNAVYCHALAAFAFSSRPRADCICSPYPASTVTT